MSKNPNGNQMALIALSTCGENDTSNQVPSITFFNVWAVTSWFSFSWQYFSFLRNLKLSRVFKLKKINLYAIVVFVSEISLVRFRIRQQLVNIVRPHFPWSILYGCNTLKSRKRIPTRFGEIQNVSINMFQCSCLCNQNQPIGICSWQLLSNRNAVICDPYMTNVPIRGDYMKY